MEEIERYLLHQMPPEEAAAFAQKLSLDAALQRSVAEMQVLLLGIQETTLAAKLDGFHESTQKEQFAGAKKSAKIFSFKRLLIAAIVIGIVVLGAWAALFNKSETDNLFAQYFKPDSGLVTAMSGTPDYAFDRAMVDYKTGNYNAAIDAWSSLQKKGPATDTLLYFLGAAHLAANDAGRAIGYLQRVATAPAGAFYYDAAWYLGLAYLKQKNTKEAIVFIRKSNHPQKYALLAQLIKQASKKI